MSSQKLNGLSICWSIFYQSRSRPFIILSKGKHSCLYTSTNEMKNTGHEILISFPATKGLVSSNELYRSFI